VSLDPFDPQAWVVLAEAQIAGNNHIKISELELRKQNQTEALASADQAVALAPEDTGLLQWRGDFAAEHGAEILQRFARAMRFYTQALRLDPTSTTLLLRRARAAERADREAEAIADYRAILRLEPGATIAAYELGMNQLSLGRFADAIDTFETLQSEFPLLSGDTSPESSEIAQLIIVARAGRGEDCVAEAQQLLIRAAWRATQMFFYPTSGNANRTRHNWTVSRNCAVRPRKRRLGRVWAECPHPAGHEQRNPKSTRRRHPVHKSAR
jgi:tetratricopeptide (TPR) repeat protein